MARIWPSVQMEQHTLSPTCDETEKVRVQEWIRSNIRRKDCIRYENPAGNNSDPMAPCYCNYKKSDHSYEVQSKTDDKSTWNSKSHIQASPTNAFGEIKFSDNESKNCKYVRLDVETEKEKTLTLLTGMWNLPKPNLLISITTRAEPFKVKPRLQNIFQRDLMKAIQMTGAWIITDGARRGITQLVGKTARDQELTTTNRERRVVAIGVAAWRDISDKEELIDDKLCGKWPAKYSAGDLDPNHSYFMLADDGAYKRGSDISFRTALGKAVSDMKTDNGTDAGHIPHVLIAADGGIETLETIQRSLKNETPTVVVKGSGRAAEIIAFAAQKCRRESVVGNDEKGRYQLVTRGVIDDKLEAEIKELMDKEYQDMKDRETVDEQFMFVKECLQRLDLLVIFDISSKESSDEIDTAILKALFKDKIQPARKLLDLALAFNNVDLAKSDIFTSGKFLSYRDLDAVMKSALEMNRASFVEVLLDHVNLDLFLTAEILVQLYNTLSPKSLLYGMLDKYRGKKKYVSLKDVGDLLKSMIPNFEHYYLTDKNIHSLDITKIMEPRPEDPDEDSDMRPCEDLFLWSVLAGYHDIADVFWRQGQDTLVAAVVGNHLMKAMMDKAPDGELKAKYEAKALEYEKLSVGILQELYTADEEKTQQLLISPLKNWGNTSIVAIALHADNKKFISQAACQSLLTQIWRGKVKTEDNHLVRKSLPSNTTETTSPGKFQIIPKYLINVKERVKRYEFVDFLQAPVGIFVMNVVSFLIFLLLYSYVLLFEMKQKKITVGEILLIIWVLTLFLEEIRQIYAAHNIKSERIKNYIHNWWNVIDMVILGKFVVGLILRSVDNFEVYSAGRFVLAINVLTFFLRILHIFSIHKELGPKLVMIQKMFENLCYFMMILFVFLASYAVASEAILNQNLELSAKYIFVDLFRKAYFHIYGELFMDGDDYEASTVVGSYVVMYVLGFYMLICNVLLLNLLIAMFSTTYAKIQDQSADYWHFQRYSLIQEYSSRPFLPPPFIIFNHVYRLIMEKCLKENKNKDKGGLTAQRVEMSTEEKELLIWENTVVRQNFHQRRDKDKEQLSLDNQLQMTADRISHIVEKIDGLEIDKRLKAVEDQMTQSVQTLISLSRTGLNNSSSKSHEVEPLTSLQNRTPSVPEETQDEEKPNEKEENNEAEEQKPVHIASRSFYYDMTSVLRFPVPDDKVHWETSFPGYEPVIYTDFAVLSSENPEVDPVDLLTMDPSNRVAVLPFNNPDGAHKCDRRSHAGEYDVVDGLPQNPYGRTGIKGRGSLGRWGPNHVQHGILTRWKRNANRKKKIKDGKPILEFIALQRIDKKDGIYLLPVVKDLQYEFIDSVRSQASEQMKNQIENRLKAMQSEDEEIYHGYADDPRNTDNAWVETIALNYHDEEDLQSYYTVKTKQGTGVTSVSWQDVSSETSVWGFHSYLLGCTAELRGANF